MYSSKYLSENIQFLGSICWLTTSNQHQYTQAYEVILKTCLYLGTILEIDAQFIELHSDSLSDICASIACLARENAGFLGDGNDKLSFVNIAKTSDIAGRSIALSSTHRRPT